MFFGYSYSGEGYVPLSEEQDLFNQAKQMNADGVPESISRSILASRMNKHATGVKVRPVKTHRD